ncbi:MULTISPECIES: 16S rRNA (guanine(966)-N(2))-methyltransferase RsmD [Aerococcus]|uniref:16S rRNA (Guanine(966)-N(2))-methyltransferase RsmD n=2 Tax=Aerococcus TaxID=1375 RepID=A0ABT4BYV5_9LACT|nr:MULTISPECIES: 16S rRNA (guanine(966)-N(2))-methyltransferase RsmD [Aerococcus]MCY3024890.1 16S rRNA (guanine(966)-N(2))-methyltransferase RsmD [Aerococcus loyolae]MCY3026844.1 16S rRNA (guanine(966)-N(2))-methyltransferase RsmD [Aerococcus loyolae]MCY3028812.1 16S rRNA (guanine(966)-N(2))-methyltransferase RsmD [Aerococcus loyolae]MDK6231726.1 16S rRNA (guanine(966)-N(2))-methyltransferase RsmD [Aerococcus urinae]MDK6257855.1 16S rRNA (guanine(966)-N(2))-methyltransferase RsmD [Aerococcus u
MEKGCGKMRIIAGEFGGIPLQAVPGSNTRPTTDKIKESMFNIIGQYLDGGIVLDFYAGSGALGLEALSRGADEVYAFERFRKAQETIAKNVAKAHIEERYHLLKGDNQKQLKSLRKKAPNLQFDWVFLDPPYKGQHLEDLLIQFQEEGWLSDQVTVVCELDSQDNLPDTVGNLHAFKNATYGHTRVVCYRFAA